MPGTSTLSQVLLSIQAFILNPLPLQQEPAFEAHAASPAGRLLCARYNTRVRLAALRHGVLEPLAAPPFGFEDLAAAHFWHKRDELRRQLVVWGEEAVLTARFELEIMRWALAQMSTCLVLTRTRSAPCAPRTCLSCRHGSKACRAS